MGHPKLKKRTYRTPKHPWQKERIGEEKELLKEFGLKNKKEIWKASSLLRKYTRQAKKLIALSTPQAELEKKQLITKLSLLGLLNETSKIEDVLTLTLKDILNRRLQTILLKNKLSKSMRQSRQFITHEHVIIGDKKITSPSYIVSIQEESQINFASNSSLASQDHPERSLAKEDKPTESAKTEEKKEDKKTEKKEDKPKKTEKKEEKKEDKKTEKKEDKPKKSEKKEEKKEDKKEDKKSEKKEEKKEEPKTEEDKK
jgi:small subunit ribosomal protein S4